MQNKSTQSTEGDKPLPLGVYVVLSIIILLVGCTLYLGVTKWLNFSAGIFCLFSFFYLCYTGERWWHRILVFIPGTPLRRVYGLSLLTLLFLAFICFLSSI
jgi:hypothetical protein